MALAVEGFMAGRRREVRKDGKYYGFFVRTVCAGTRDFGFFAFVSYEDFMVSKSADTTGNGLDIPAFASEDWAKARDAAGVSPWRYYDRKGFLLLCSTQLITPGARVRLVGGDECVVAQDLGFYQADNLRFVPEAGLRRFSALHVECALWPRQRTLKGCLSRMESNLIKWVRQAGLPLWPLVTETGEAPELPGEGRGVVYIKDLPPAVEHAAVSRRLRKYEELREGSSGDAAESLDRVLEMERERLARLRKDAEAPVKAKPVKMEPSKAEVAPAPASAVAPTPAAPVADGDLLLDLALPVTVSPDDSEWKLALADRMLAFLERVSSLAPSAGGVSAKLVEFVPVWTTNETQVDEWVRTGKVALARRVVDSRLVYMVPDGLFRCVLSGVRVKTGDARAVSTS
ncbi:hypothetical protein OH491_23625 [Termitidicoccus mucosus]|uniref:hypothetical protein n=1 Tax=Termitidicoccus mucosus TaxID=1184151 RepID=UPI0011AB5E00